ncbi:ribonuclease 2-like [Silene latifolia]|uniref:ribonuclease 2-like n=1 Tax=Silene latifolia TaxID=37657 RepID=UPI003D782987
MAKLIAIAVLSPLIVSFLVGSSASFSVANNGGLSLRNSNHRDFDYFVLALQWPPTNCRNTNTLHCCKSNACCSSSGPPQHFTIHGLWCNYNDGSWPSCCGDNNFDEKEISTLQKALDDYWPTLFCGSTSTCHGHKGSFYAHERSMVPALLQCLETSIITSS